MIRVRLNITAEGFAEERFVSDLLRPHLLKFGIYTEVRKILTSRKLRKRGGMLSYAKLKNDLTQWIKESPDVYHTTLIDLYGLKADFPAYITTKHLQAYPRIQTIEKAFEADISFRKFIPYIQLHEYEALMFSSPVIMQSWLGLYGKLPDNCFQNIRNGYKTPEEINDSPVTAPSKRILDIYRAMTKLMMEFFYWKK